MRQGYGKRPRAGEVNLFKAVGGACVPLMPEELLEVSVPPEVAERFGCGVEKRGDMTPLARMLFWREIVKEWFYDEPGINREVSARFAFLRESMGFSDVLCAAGLGVHRRQIRFWEASEREIPVWARVWLGREWVKWSIAQLILEQACRIYGEVWVQIPKKMRNRQRANGAECASLIMEKMMKQVAMNAEREGLSVHYGDKHEPSDVLAFFANAIEVCDEDWADALMWCNRIAGLDPKEAEDLARHVFRANHHRGKYVPVAHRRAETALTVKDHPFIH